MNKRIAKKVFRGWLTGVRIYSPKQVTAACHRNARLQHGIRYRWRESERRILSAAAIVECER